MTQDWEKHIVVACGLAFGVRLGSRIAYVVG